MYKLKISNRKNKKYMIITPSNKKIHFGDSRYSDYTIHKDNWRKYGYIKRHRKRENWNYDGINTAGFWSRWILWNRPNFYDSIRDTMKKFKIKIKL